MPLCILTDNATDFNAGFFVMQPSIEVLRYYLRFTSLPDRFSTDLMEQNLLNYAHRPEGNMPWQHLDSKWTTHYPTQADVDGGVHALHEKWWAPVHEELRPFLESWRWRMEGFYEAQDQIFGR